MELKRLWHETLGFARLQAYERRFVVISTPQLTLIEQN